MQWIAVAGFLVAVTPLTVTPGASFTLATQQALTGERTVRWVVLGTATGILVHALLAAAGLSAVVMRSAEAFTVVRVVGGVYLVGLGLATLLRSRRARVPAEALPARPQRSGRRPYRQALLGNVLNPKAASVYLTLAPQFLAADQVGILPMLVLATAHIAVMSTWLLGWTWMLRRGGRRTRSDRFGTVVDRIGGAVLIALGVRTAVAR